ncbi:MAG: lytic murein transglycosylase [Proteobacteria bacterium]|nr:lytic murein transglycosylase [Pseudomonadota bacterium]MBU1739081.1 lytic murein transglycosylase [Pseudomonadota bacterium]
MLVVLCLFHPGSAMVALDFATWLEELQREAQQEGISAATLETALSGVALSEKVIALDRNQPEFTLDLESYLARTVSEARVAKGRELLENHRQILAEIAKKYGVQPRFLVAFWGIETDFGRIFGDFPVIGSLATLAFDERRGRYFRKELLHALHILDDGLISRELMIGSWAGAMGGLQFMPSVFREYAVDHDGDGRVDLWRNPGDLFASGGNYLGSSGWQDDQTWGREVKLPAGFDRSLTGHDRVMTISEWRELGARRIDGSPLPRRDLAASLIIPDENGQRVFLAYDNYRVILKWNRSDYFAVAVGTLADRLGKGE